MPKEVSKVGEGFFSSSGSLKSKEELNKSELIPAPTKTPPSNSPATEIKELPTQLSPQAAVKVALNAERTRVSTAANNEISKVNNNGAVLKKAVDVTNRQIAKNEELKKANADGDSERAEQVKQELAELAKEKEAVKKAADQLNKENGPPVEKKLRVGNKEVGAGFSAAKVKVENQADSNSSNPDKAIESLKSELSGLNGQIKQNAETEKNLAASVAAAKAELDKIEENNVKTADKAQQLANKVADAIRDNSDTALSAFNAKSEVVKALVT